MGLSILSHSAALVSQDMSVAGKRAGLDGSRSSLFHEAIRIIKEMREATNGEQPRFAVWENVCFTAGTLVTTEYGYKNIEDVYVGDKVKTLSGKYMPVMKIHKTRKQEVLRIKASGSEPLTCTYNHPFYAKRRVIHSAGVPYKNSFAEPQWVKAGEMTTEDLVGYVLDTPDERMKDFLTEDEAWAVGRWLADGSVDISKCSPRIFISCGNAKIEATREKLSKLPYNIHENRPHPTALNFAFTSWEFYKLIESAGKGAGNKRVPPYIFKLPIPIQKAVLEGYISGDGYIRKRKGNVEFSANTASRQLAYGIMRLIRNCYHEGCSLSVKPAKDGIIDGRILNANYPCYGICASLESTKSKSFVENGILWQPIKSIEQLDEKATVYNLSVKEDNTYEVNNIIVHNCGAYSSNSGEDFRCVLEEICKVKDEFVSVPKPAKWAKAGYILGDGYSVAYRTMDSQFWGVPQRRKRIFLVADFASECAGNILFESEGLSGYSAEGFRAWQRAAGGLADCTGTSGRLRCVLNDQGGNRMDVTEDVTCTLRAEAHHPPLVFENHSQDCRYTGPLDVSQTVSATYGMGGNNQPFVVESAGFCTEHSAKARSIGYEEETSPTLRAGVVPAAIALENHPADSRVTIAEDDVCQTLTSRCGTGGGNVPLLLDAPVTLKIRAGCEGGGKGALLQTNKSATLACNNDQTLFVPFVKGTRPHSAEEGQTWKQGETANTVNTFDVGENRCNELVVRAYGICSKDSNSMKSSNPHSGIYEASTSRTIDGNGGNPACNQGGIVVLEGNGSRPSHHGNGYKQSETMYTLNATENHSVSYGIDRAAFNQGQNARYNIAIEEELEPTIVAKGPGAVAHTFSTSKASFFTRAEEELANTLVATDYKDPPVVNDMADMEYIVRRLTPQECALLMGMPTWWCQGIASENPTEKEIDRWTKIFEDYRLTGKPDTKPKTRNQIIKWLRKPHSDSAEYTMWGNGVCLPNAWFVLAGIAWIVDNAQFTPQ